MLIFYDFEVFKHDWLVVLITPFEKETVTIVNDPGKLTEYYEKHKSDIWIGYNSRNYDQYILKAILLGFDVKKVSDWLISGRKGHEFSSLFNTVQLYNYDCQNKFNSLKQLEGFMGNNIKETSVNFNIDRKLTADEIAETIKYCTHDVQQTMQVFLKTKSKFDAQVALLKAFDLPINNIGKTQAQLAAIILGATPIKTYDEWDIRIPDNLMLNKYKYVADWFLNKTNHDYDKKLETHISGVEHIFAWGGVHGAARKYEHTCTRGEMLLMADVDQLYPTIMIKYNLLSRAVKQPEKFKYILDTSLRLKAEKKKKERQPYKDVCNITYGSMGDQFNSMYDPLHRTLVCVFGQLFLVDLLEKLEKHCELIQSNTDGILIKIKTKDFELIDDIVYEWEERTGLHMSFDMYKRVIQKDVNNYVAVDYEGKYKSKGAYVKSLNDLDNDLPIVNKAMMEYMLKRTPVEATVNSCDDLKMFQKIVKVSSKYICGYHNHKRLNDKTFRVFASKNTADTSIGKVKDKNGAEVVEKFANTPEHCFIENGDVNGVTVPSKLDKQYYIDVALKRLSEFGVM